MKQRFILTLLILLGYLPLGVGRLLGALLGRLFWRLGGRMVRVTHTNLAVCLPELPAAERYALARRSIIDTTKAALEIAIVWRRSDAWLESRIVQYQGRELLTQAVAQKKGLIVLTPHTGNWEVISVLLTKVAPMTALYQPQKNTALDHYICNARQRSGVALAPTNRRGVATLMKSLKRGGMLCILPDQVPDLGNGSVSAPFFGEPAQTMTLVHSLMQRTGCEVLLGYVLRVPGGFKAVIRPCDPAIYEREVTAAVTGLNRSVEMCARDALEQYQWEYKRFKGRTQPEPY